MLEIRIGSDGSHAFIIHYDAGPSDCNGIKDWLCNKINNKIHSNNNILYIAWSTNDKSKVNCQECLEYLHS